MTTLGFLEFLLLSEILSMVRKRRNFWSDNFILGLFYINFGVYRLVIS